MNKIFSQWRNASGLREMTPIWRLTAKYSANPKPLHSHALPLGSSPPHENSHELAFRGKIHTRPSSIARVYNTPLYAIPSHRPFLSYNSALPLYPSVQFQTSTPDPPSQSHVPRIDNATRSDNKQHLARPRPSRDRDLSARSEHALEHQQTHFSARLHTQFDVTPKRRIRSSNKSARRSFAF